jgi:RNA polymerase sigma-70 factor (ECF subfamily)
MVLEVLREAGLATDWDDRHLEFQRLYRDTWPEVFKYTWLLLRHREDAEDVASEAYRRALEAWHAGRRPKGEVLPWLFTIARRVAIDRHRRRRLIGWLTLDSAAESPDRASELAFHSSELWIWFEGLCQVLPAAQREALLLRFQFDLPDAETARIMGRSEGNVRSLVSRGLATLKARPEVMQR